MQDSYRSSYSFINVSGGSRKSAMIISSFALGSLVCILVLVAVSVYKGGSLPWYCGTLGYASFLVSVISLYESIRLRAYTQAFGRYVNISLYLSIISLAAHVFVVLTGWMSVIV